MLSPIKISLDFYDNNIVRINAKQYDKKRTVNIVCTENGKKIKLDKDTMTIYIGCKKSDGNYGFYDAEILDDGSILWELEEQLLINTGIQKMDVCVAATSGIKVDNLKDITSVADLGVALVSTMPLYINVVPTLTDHEEIGSASEIDALNSALTRLAYTETHLKEVESTLNSNEETRKSNENARVDAETKRNEAENMRASSFSSSMDDWSTRVSDAVKACNDIKEKCENVYSVTAATNEECNDTITRAESAITNTKAATKNANEAATKANEAAELCKSVVDHTGVVLQTEKGVPDGVATLDDGGLVPYSQLPFTIVNNTTTELKGTVLDGRIGKTLSDNITNLITTITDLEGKANELESKLNNTINYYEDGKERLVGHVYDSNGGEVELYRRTFKKTVNESDLTTWFGTAKYYEIETGWGARNNNIKVYHIDSITQSEPGAISQYCDPTGGEGDYYRVFWEWNSGNIHVPIGKDNPPRPFTLIVTIDYIKAN